MLITQDCVECSIEMLVSHLKEVCYNGETMQMCEKCIESIQVHEGEDSIIIYKD